jgi:uncharacterized protein (TIGR02099 family)
MRLRKIIKILLYGIAGSLILIATLMMAVKLALDSAPQYQAEIKDWVHRQTGFHVGFSHVSPAFRWYGPELYFDRLELRSKDDQRVLARAAGGRVGLDFWQLLHSGKLYGLRLELDAPDIVVARTGPKTFALASEIVLSGQDSTMGSLTLDDLPAGTLAIREGFITIQDWNAALPELKLHRVHLDLRRGLKLATLALDADLPPVLGGALSVNATARGGESLTTLGWGLVVSARGMSFPGWRQLLPDYLTRLDGGTGAFRLVARGQGAVLARADLDVNARDVVAKLTEGASATFVQISGAFFATHANDRWTVGGRRVHAQRLGARDPDSQFDVSWRASESGVLELTARASYLRAEALLPLAGLMPQKDLRERLRDIAPTGEWTDMRAELARASAADPWRLSVHANFRDVGFAPLGRAPGLRGLNGMLAGNESGGHVSIESRAAVYSWPGQFSQPIGVSRLVATFYWKRTADEFLVATRDFELEARNASLHAKMAWQQPGDGGSPILTLAATVDNGNVADTHLFLPRELLAPAALAWLDRAFIAGHLSHADAVFQGPVRHFPFRDGTGVFVARCNIDGLVLDYLKDWPRIENLAGQAEFRNEGMTAKIVGGRTGDLVIDGGDARFVDFKNGELKVHAAIHADAGEGLQFLRATPLDAMAEGMFSGVDATGPFKSGVDLFLPFKAFDQRRFQVHLSLGGVSVNPVGSTLAATELAGEADIDGAQVAHADVHGRVLGGAFQMTARSPRNRPPTRTQLEFKGVFGGEALRTALALPASFAVAGQADWHGTLKVVPDPARERSLHLTSNLAGLEMRLPEPLMKPAGRPLPASVEVQWPQGGASTQVRVVLGSVLRTALALDSDANGAKLAHAAVVFGTGEPVFSDAQIFNVGGHLETVDLTGWLRLAAAPKNAKPLASYLRSAKLEVARLDFLGLSFRDVALALSQCDDGWRVAVGGPNVVGSLSLPAALDASAPWTLEFKQLAFASAASEAGAPEDAETGAGQSGGAVKLTDPRSIPAINFHAADVRWDDRQLGDVRATLVRLDDGVGLRLLKAAGATDEVTALGAWRGKDGGLGHIEGTLTSTDVGDTLKRLGFEAVIQAKTGRLEFYMNWIGAPTGSALQAATGHVQVALDKGQIVGLKPGAGRVLGLASVAELPRRLALDFSDLTDKGFAFDSVRGDFDLHDGSAFTENVLVKGPAAEIGLIGRVGLKNHDYDQTAVVTGSVGNSLPLAAFAAGPVIGGAVLLFTQVFKQPLKGLVRGYYRITGSWDSPTVERIKSAGAAATAEAPK